LRVLPFPLTWFPVRRCGSGFLLMQFWVRMPGAAGGTQVKQLFFLSLFAILLTAAGCGGGHFSSGSDSGSGPGFSNRFTAGIAHVSGNYGFTHNNYLGEGA